MRTAGRTRGIVRGRKKEGRKKGTMKKRGQEECGRDEQKGEKGETMMMMMMQVVLWRSAVSHRRLELVRSIAQEAVRGFDSLCSRPGGQGCR